MTVLLRRFHASALVALVVSTLVFLCGTRLFAQTPIPERIVSPVRTDLPGRTVWAFATTGTGTNITTFAATDKGLYKSSGGAWALTSLDKQSVYAVKSRRVGNVTTLLVGTDKGVLRSTDGGNTWASPEVTTGTAIATSNIVSLKKVFDIEVVGTNWFVATEKGVYRSSNDGRSWSLVNIDRTADNNEVRGITVDGNTIIVNLWKEGLWRSTNNGSSWTKLTITGETALCRTVYAQQGTNATVWLAGSVSGNIWRSVNSGTSWTQVYQGTSAARSIAASALTQAGIDAFTGTGSIIFASTPSGIAYSRSYGQTWRHTRTTNPQAVSMTMLSNQIFVGFENSASSLALKETSSLTGGNDATAVYNGFCPPEFDYSGTCTSSGGGGGSSGGGTVIPGNPYISNITPNPAQQTNAPVAITITGTGFNGSQGFVGSQVEIYAGSIGSWQKLTPFVSQSATEIVVNVPAQFTNTVGINRIRVYNGSEIVPSTETPISQEVFWTVVPPPPVLNNISPLTALAGTNITLTANGDNFGTIGELLVDGTVPLELTSYTTRINTQVSAMFPTPPARATPYNVSVRVGAQTTGTKPLTVYNPLITLNTPATSQTPPIAGQSFTVNLTGSGFLAGVTQISVNGSAISGASIGSGTISFPFTGSGGPYTVTVQNPLTASGTSIGTGNFTIQTPPPAPTVSSLTQNGSAMQPVVAGSGAQIFTVNGSGFQANTVVQVNGSSSGMTVQSWTASAITVQVPSTSFQTGLQTLNITAYTPPLNGLYGGGVSATSLPLYVVMATPTLSLNAITVPAGSGGQEISFSGIGIVAGQTLLRWTSGTSSQDFTVQANGMSSWKSFLSSSLFQYPTAASIRLYNPAWQTFGGGLSNAVDATVSNTTPLLDSINPRSYAWLGVETQIPVYVYGAGFTPSTVFRFSNGTSSVDLRPTPINFAATRVLLDVPFATVGLTPPGILTVRAINPALRVGEADLLSVRTDTLRVVNPAPALFAQTLQYPVTQLPTSVTLNGSSFLLGVSASIDGVAADVVRNSANQITVTLNAAVQARIQALGAGTHHIIVRNVAPAAGDASLPLVVTNPAIPTVTVTPNPYQLTAPPSAQLVTLTALSSGAPPYIATNASVTFRGQTFPFASRPSQSQITVTIPASLLDAAGSFPITITNPKIKNPVGSDSLGGGSQSAAWQLNNPRPVVTSMSSNPTSALAGTDVVLTLDGSAFVPAAAVVWRGNTYTPTSNTGTRITVTIPAAALDSAGSFAVIMRNPSGGGDAVNQPALTVLAPRPRLATLGQQALTLSLTNPQALVLNIGGSGFVRGSRFVWNVLGNQSSITTTYTNSNTLTATIPANLLTQAGIYRVAVVNDPFNGQGGGVSDTLTFTVNNPQASITTLQPSNLLPRFAASAPLTFIGSDFITGARLLVTGLNNVVDTLTTQVQSATQLTATLPASLLDSAATLTLRILNPAPTVNVSNGVSAYVVNPRPRLLSLSQTSTLTGLPSLTLTANGSQFMDGAVGYANNVALQTVVNNTGSLTLTVPASALAVAGTVLITVQNPLPRVQPDVSDTLLLKVDNPLPQLDSATSVITVSTQATTVQLYGANFILASGVKENGGGRTESTLSSNRLSQTQMTATVPATLTDVAGTLRLVVENPTPGGGRSQSVSVAVVHPVPTAQRITPSVVTMSASDVNVVITGDRFVNTADVLVNGQTVTVTLRAPTRLTATIPAALLATRGAYNVVVRNPATVGNDGGTSATLTLTVNTPQPLVTSIDLNGSPNQVPLDTVDVPLTVNGSRFQDSAIVRIVPPSGGTGTVIPTQSITGNKITALIPASALTVGGVYSVVVENLAPTDAPSVPVTFAVVNPVPQMDSISTNGATPTVVVGMTTPQTITVFGQKFTPTSVVKWRGQNLVTTFVNRNTLTAVLPSALQTRGAVGAVTVFTPTDGVVLNGNPVGGGIGSALGLAGVLTVTHGVPALMATTPATLLRDAWSVSALPSLTLNGNLIASTASVRVQSTGTMNPVDTTLTPTSVNANGLSLVVAMPRSVVVTAGTFTLTITNPPAFPSAAYSNDGGTSASVSLTVQNPTPTLSSLAPVALAAASPNTLLTVNGSNLTRETQVFVNGVLAPRTILSATQFTTTLPASLFTLSGFVRVQVLNPAPSVSGAPAGDSSNTLSLEVYNPVPTLTTANPVFAPIGGRSASDSVTITLVGTNFVRNSVARIATTVAGAPTTDLPTTFVATTTLTVRMLPADWKAQAYNMTVFNPLPRGGTSAAKRFTVTNPLPVLTALLPNSTTATGKVWTLRTVGNFFTATSQISYNKVLQSLVNTTYIPNALTPSTQDTLLVKLPAVPVGDTTFPVVVYNPPTGGVGGGASDTLRLAVGLPAPTITSLSPATTTATFGDKNRAWTLTVNGTLFDDAAQVLVNGVPVPTSFVSTTRLRAVLPDSMQSVQARRTVQVRNTPVLLSNLTTLTVQNPAPVLSLISPSTITAGRDTTLVLAGDRFAPDATVRLVYGGVTTVLTPSKRDSVNSVTVPLPANLITAQGAYSVQIINKGLQPTMIPPDTTVLGGGSDALTLTVQHDALAIVEYIGVDTLVNAGGNMPAFTVRFRDRVQNLVDNDGAIVYYASTTGSVASYWSLTRTSLGTYRTPVTPFPQAESYRLWVDTAAYGALAVVGANRFRVQALADSIVTFTGLETRAYVAAGDTLPSFTAAIVDKLGNPTDNSTLRFSYARSAAVGVIAAAPASGATVRSARLQTGLYRIESTVATIAGVYTYSLVGIPTHVGQRSVEVMPRTPASVDFASVKEIVVAGQKQTAVQVTYRDRYGNLTDSLSPTQNRLWYSNSTDATVSSTESLTVSETLTQRVYTKTGVPLSGFPYRGIYDASNAVTFPAAAKYSLAVDGVTTTTGTTAFEVVPNVDVRVVMEGLKDTITAGETLPAFTVRYFDINGNPTDNTVGRVTYRHATLPLVSTATIGMMRVSEGVYAVQSTEASLAGLYNMTVSGIATANITGNKVFVVRPAIASTATFVASTTPMTRSGSKVTLTVSYKDRYGNLTDNASTWKFESTDIEGSTGTVSLTRKTGQPVGVFTTTFTVFTPGGYRLDVNDTQGSEPIVQRVKPLPSDFSVLPGPMRRATWVGVQPKINPGVPQTYTVQMFDTLNAPTTYWDGTLTANFSGAANGTMTFTQPEYIDQYGEPQYPLPIVQIAPTAFTAPGNYTLLMNLTDALDPVTNKIISKWQNGVRTFTVLNPTITINPTVLNFGTVDVHSVSASQSYTVGVQNLTIGNLVITASAGYTIRQAGMGVFSQTLTIPAAQTASPITVEVQFTPTQNGVQNGTITHTPNATPVVLNVTGIGRIVPKLQATIITSTMPPPQTLDMGTASLYQVLPPKEYRLDFSDVNDNIVITAPTHYQIRVKNTTQPNQYTQVLTLPATTVSPVTLEVVFAPMQNGTLTGNITHQTVGASDKNLSVTGNCIGDPLPPSSSVFTVISDFLINTTPYRLLFPPTLVNGIPSLSKQFEMYSTRSAIPYMVIAPPYFKIRRSGAEMEPYQRQLIISKYPQQIGNPTQDGSQVVDIRFEPTERVQVIDQEIKSSYQTFTAFNSSQKPYTVSAIGYVEGDALRFEVLKITPESVSVVSADLCMKEDIVATIDANGLDNTVRVKIAGVELAPPQLKTNSMEIRIPRSVLGEGVGFTKNQTQFPQSTYKLYISKEGERVDSSLRITLLTSARPGATASVETDTPVITVQFLKDAIGQNTTFAVPMGSALNTILAPFGLSAASFQPIDPSFIATDTLFYSSIGNYWIKRVDMRNIMRLQAPSAEAAESLVNSLRALPNVLWASVNDQSDKSLLTIPNDRFYQNPPQLIRQFHGFFQSPVANGNLHPLWHLGDPTHARVVTDAHIYAYKAWDNFNYHGSAAHTMLICDAPLERHNDYTENNRLKGFNWNYDIMGNLIESASNVASNPHGTNVTGLAAATGNNGKGVVGLDWNVKIRHGGLVGDIIFPKLISEEENKKTRVSNHSYGTYVFDEKQNQAFALAYNLDHLPVVAAGNYFNLLPPQPNSVTPPSPFVNPIFYPAAYYGVLCVGGTDETDHRYYTTTAPASRYLNAVAGTTYPNYSPSFILEELDRSVSETSPGFGSHTGYYVDIVAPSVRMLSTTVNRPDQACADNSSKRYDEIIDQGDLYRVVGYGTSFAAPLVTGAASLLFGFAEDKLTPSKRLHADDARNLLLLSTDLVHRNPSNTYNKFQYIYRQRPVEPNSSRPGDPLARPWNEEMGHGRLNVYRALKFLKDGSLFEQSTRDNALLGVGTPRVISGSQRNFTNVKIIGGIHGVDVAGTYTIRRYEVRQDVVFPTEIISKLVANNQTKPKMWGIGSLMSEYGLASVETGFIGTTQNASILSGAGWCDPDPATITGTGAVMRTYIYAIVTSENGVEVETFFPNRTGTPIKDKDIAAERVKFFYTVYVPPLGETIETVGVTALASLKSSGEVTNAAPPSLGAAQTIDADMYARLDAMAGLEVFPNPVYNSNDASCSFTIPESGFVRVEVYNMLGQKRTTLTERLYTPGRYTLPNAASTLESGAYRVQMTFISERGIQRTYTKSLTILK